MRERSNRLVSLGAQSAALLVRVVFPATCAGCGAIGNWLCELCDANLIDIGCQPLPASSRAFEIDDSLEGGSAPVTLRARFAYTGPVRQAVHLLKYSGERARAEWFAEVMAPLLAGTAIDGTLIVPVPLTPRREGRRGFNQSKEIAARLSKSLGIPTADAVTRIRETRPQVELNGIERLHNVRGAFAGSTSLRGRHVVLVDDVVTTGATMRECGHACYVAGAASVVGAAGAAGIDRGKGTTQ